ncbi:MAG: GNAT family N-acetyltransferase, partial [Microbacterium sp.]
MTLLTDELTITEMVLPASVDASDAAEFLALADLNNELCVVDTATNVLHEEPAEMLPHWLDRSDSTSRGY